MLDHERIAVEPCGCRYDVRTGVRTAACPRHDPKALIEEARRICEVWASRNEDAMHVRELLGRALEAMGR